MQEEHCSGPGPALCAIRRHGYMMTSRGHDRKRLAIVERSTPGYVEARAWLDLTCSVLFCDQSASCRASGRRFQHDELMRIAGGHSIFVN